VKIEQDFFLSFLYADRADADVIAGNLLIDFDPEVMSNSINIGNDAKELFIREVNININEIKKILIEKFNYHFDAEHRSLKDEELKLYVLPKSRNGIKVAQSTYIHEIKYGYKNTAVMVQNGIIIDSQIKELAGELWDRNKNKIK